LAADGALDPTFGPGGIVTTDFGGSSDYASDIALQPDNKLIVAGSNFSGSDYDFALARYNGDGSLDPTFGADGKVTTDFGSGDNEAQAVALQPDGKIIAAGGSFIGDPNNDDFVDFALARYSNNGSLDTTFDGDGMVNTDFGGKGDNSSAIILQPDGKIILVGGAGGSNYDFALARYNGDGSLDATFGTGGKVTTDFSNSDDFGIDATLQPDGKIVVTGTSSNGSDKDFALARYNNDGSLDASFDTDGKVTTYFGNVDEYGNAVALQTDGKIIVTGISSNYISGYFALARYNSDGSLDTTFDTDGKVTTDFGNSSGFGYAATLQPDGKIVVAGTSSSVSNNDFALSRYNSDGSLDTTFDTDGKVTTDFGHQYDFGQAVALQPDGKIIAVGYSNLDFALARYDVSASAIEVTIDIKPGRAANRIELEKQVCKDDDNLYVAILTTPDFDALSMDASTLTLGDPLLSGTVSPVRSRIRDVDLDGDMDMALAFPLCNLVTDEALNESTTELVLTGSTLDGVSITGRDSVKVVRDD